jgi:hypothetical protein
MAVMGKTLTLAKVEEVVGQAKLATLTVKAMAGTELHLLFQVLQ